jgi:spoIIIJ-associated protein
MSETAENTEPVDEDVTLTDEVEEPAAADQSAGETPDEADDADKGNGLTRLEEEGEIAADYLEELLDIADLDGDIELDVDHGRASVAIVTDGDSSRRLQRLVGDDGEVLEAVQDLTRLAVQASTGERSRLMLDIAGYRAERRAELVRIAEKAIEDVKAKGVSVSMEPMNAFERKVVHDTVSAAGGLVSESSGVEPERFVVIRPE